MVVTYSNLHKVEFPVFPIGSSNWTFTDGLLYLDNELLDDKNMSGKTLGARRIQTPFHSLYTLKKCIETPVGILKQTKNTYIDNKGTPFIYSKTKMVPLKYYSIERVVRKETASVLWLKGISYPFAVPRPPLPEFAWAGILHLNNAPWVLYEYSENKESDTRRKV